MGVNQLGLEPDTYAKLLFVQLILQSVIQSTSHQSSLNGLIKLDLLPSQALLIQQKSVPTMLCINDEGRQPSLCMIRWRVSVCVEISKCSRASWLKD